MEAFALDADGVSLVVTARTARARCPSCGRSSRRVHSRYRRSVADVAWGGAAVTCHLLMRRFRCGRAACPQRIFCERVSPFAAAHARRTERLRALLREVGFALGGRPGERLLPAFHTTASRTTLLRLVRAAGAAGMPAVAPLDPTVAATAAVNTAPTLLGVDEWAFRRGPREQRFGTILVDLERRRAVDLLCDATADGFAAWLRAHPGAAVISRDRGGAFAEGARVGAPDALQVADRFHLLRNLGDVVRRVLARRASLVRQVPAPGTRAQRTGVGGAGIGVPDRADRRASRERTQQVMRARYAAVQELAAAGMNRSAIARALGVHRHTVQKYLPLTAPPERRTVWRHPSILAPHERYLLERWRQGSRNALALWRELRRRGFAGQYRSVARLVAHWKHLERSGVHVPPPPPGLTPRHATALLLLRPERRTEEEQRAVVGVRTVHPEVQTAVALLDRFAALIRTTSAAPPTEREARVLCLARWLADATHSGVSEVQAFAKKLQQDLAAVQAGLTLPYSQGQTEGHITRLKALKRQMYGRANFDLVRLRFLSATYSIPT